MHSVGANAAARGARSCSLATIAGCIPLLRRPSRFHITSKRFWKTQDLPPRRNGKCTQPHLGVQSRPSLVLPHSGPKSLPKSRCRRYTGAIVGTAVLVLAHQSPSQDCSDLSPATGPTGYRLRKEDKRCEGLYVPRVSGGGIGIDLVSLTWGKLNWSVGKDVVLELATALPTNKAVLHIVGTGISSGFYYRMEADTRAARLKLPLSAVMNPVHIQPAQVGFLGWHDEEGQRKAYVPLSCSISSRPVPIGTSIVAVVRPRGDVSNVCWRTYPTNSAPLPSFGDPSPQIVSAGQRKDITFAPPAHATQFTLEISYVSLPDRASHSSLFDIQLQ